MASYRFDVPLVSNSFNFGTGGLGVRGALVPKGDFGTHYRFDAPYLPSAFLFDNRVPKGFFSDRVHLPEDADKEFRAYIVSLPQGGNFFAREDSTYLFDGAQASTFTYELYKDGVLDSIIVYSTAGEDATQGKLVLPVLKNNTGQILANLTGITVHINTVLTNELVATKTNQQSDANGIVTIIDSRIVPNTMYRVIVILATGAEGMEKVTAV